MKMRISRRDFIKNGAMGLVGGIIIYSGIPAVLQGLTLTDAGKAVRLNRPDGKEHYWRFIVDMGKCIGCGKCVRACKLENDVPLDPEYNRTWVERYVITESDEVFIDSPNAAIDGFTAETVREKYGDLDVRKSFFVPKLCNQCEEPPCVPVCPVGATYATREGVVLVDRQACIGCKYCIQACPYGARFLDPRLKVIDKCTWCYHRITKGLPPACVAVCPVEARLFGDMRDPESQVGRMIREERLGILKPDLGTEPMVYYIGLEKGVR